MNVFPLFQTLFDNFILIILNAFSHLLKGQRERKTAGFAWLLEVFQLHLQVPNVFLGISLLENVKYFLAISQKFAIRIFFLLSPSSHRCLILWGTTCFWVKYIGGFLTNAVFWWSIIIVLFMNGFLVRVHSRQMLLIPFIPYPWWFLHTLLLVQKRPFPQLNVKLFLTLAGLRGVP